MRKRILSFIMGMLMMGTNVALASDVYITQSGASFTANINQAYDEVHCNPICSLC